MKNIRPFSRYIPRRPVTTNLYALGKYGFCDMESEIDAYVLERRHPTSPSLVAIVEHYEELHLRSGRLEY